MTVIGLFGIIGTVEYAHAHELPEQDQAHNHIHLDLEENFCDQEIILEHEQHLIISKNDTDYLKEMNIHLYHQWHETSSGIWIHNDFVNHGSKYYSINPNGNYIEHIIGYQIEPYQFLPNCKVPIYREHNLSNQHFINLIAETFNLEIPEPTEPDEPDETTQTNWKERYNTCYDKKENLKTVRDTYKSELSELQSNFDILQSNLTNANFEIDKLKQEKAQLIKQVETLETQLQEN